VRESGFKGVYCLVAILYPLALLIAMTVFSGGSAIAEDGGGPTPPPTGDWNVTVDTVLEGGEHNITGNINVHRGVSLTITNTIVNIRYPQPHYYTTHIYAGATLTVVNSTLNLDIFIAESQASISFEDGSLVKTTGRFYGSCNSFYAEDTVFRNTGRDGDHDEPGEEAVFIADGRVNSEFIRVSIINSAGNAGPTSPGADGKPGGRAELISNVTRWIDCVIENNAGSSRNGGLGLTGTSGGSGGNGADAYVTLSASYLENLIITTMASGGGIGARGSDNTAGNGGEGGDGGNGGSAHVTIVSPSTLEMYGCSVTAMSGAGGSGGNGGSGIDGDGGTAGKGADTGSCTIEISSNDYLVIEGTEITAMGAEGGYGGDYGRHEGGAGSFGIPGPGGNGGDANVEITTTANITLEDARIEARGGQGLDGGGGYAQGETGGKGGGGSVRIWSNGTLQGDEVDVTAIGGNGGPGGPTFSEIQGNGGDGGDGKIEFNGFTETIVHHPYLYSLAGMGGEGRQPIYDGHPGIPIMDIDTVYLEMWEGIINMPLDDLHGDAEGHLYNMSFDIESGLTSVPMYDARVWEYFPVTVRLGDHPNRRLANSLVGWDVSFMGIMNGTNVATNVTDDEGKAYQWLVAFYYNHTTVEYLGSYHIDCTSPDGSIVWRERLEVLSWVFVYIFIDPRKPVAKIVIEQPEEGRTYTFDTRATDPDTFILECSGYITRRDDGVVTGVSVHLHEGFGAGVPIASWDLPFMAEGSPPGGPEPLGWYFPPQEHSIKWTFYLGLDVLNESMALSSGAYAFEVQVDDGTVIYFATVSFDLKFTGLNLRPWVVITSHINGTTWEGDEMSIRGEAYDDESVLYVEYKLDDYDWRLASGTDRWSFTIDSSGLDEGTHVLQVRAYDGYVNSYAEEATFIVDLPDGTPGDGGPSNDDGPWEFQIYLVPIFIIIVIITSTVIALYYVRHRSSSDG
jgi:hypothetical protein